MHANRIFRVFALIAIATSIMGSSLNVRSADATQKVDFADPAFASVWTRTDALVLDGSVKRSYYWGPQPFTDGLMEEYAEGPGGKHLVQYFDKSRMEINNPSADKTNPFYVTNGLLTVELVTGKMQTGNNKSEFRWPASIPLASDHDDADAPTYASFGGVVKNGQLGERAFGQLVTSRINKVGDVEQVTRFGSYGVKIAYHEIITGRGIPDVFMQFLNQEGPVILGGQRTNGRLSRPYFYLTGYPISNAFWATVKIENKPDTAVLIQAYERRVLTYVPSAPEGFKVQMGNIGRHYYDWRYRDVGYCADRRVPSNGYLKLWLEKTEVQGQVWCPNDQAGDTIQMQRFERGMVIYQRALHPPAKTTFPWTVYHVLLPDGRIINYGPPPLNPAPITPGPQETPPPGLLQPDGEPGRQWRENPDARQLLGWATAPLKEVSETERYFFQRGLMVADGGKIYVLHQKTGFYYVPNALQSWTVHTDPMPPPTLQPLLGCSPSPPNEFGRLWSRDLSVQNRINCVQAGEVSIAFQPFQTGAMLHVQWQELRGSASVSRKAIYVLYLDGTIKIFEDTYTPGDPEPPQTLPQPGSRLYLPTLGFGKVWREQKLFEKLGYATALERTIGSEGSQLFRNGFMVRNADLIYALYSSMPGNFTNVNVWSQYEAR